MDVESKLFQPGPAVEPLVAARGEASESFIYIDCKSRQKFVHLCWFWQRNSYRICHQTCPHEGLLPFPRISTVPAGLRLEMETHLQTFAAFSFSWTTVNTIRNGEARLETHLRGNIAGHIFIQSNKDTNIYLILWMLLSMPKSFRRCSSRSSSNKSPSISDISNFSATFSLTGNYEKHTKYACCRRTNRAYDINTLRLNNTIPYN